MKFFKTITIFPAQVVESTVDFDRPAVVVRTAAKVENEKRLRCCSRQRGHRTATGGSTQNSN